MRFRQITGKSQTTPTIAEETKMNDYKGFEIEETDDGFFIYDDEGNCCGECDTLRAAQENIDHFLGDYK